MNDMTSTHMNWILWILKLATSVILLQTLFFKFTAAQESVYIFSKLGLEPWGRIGSGVVELLAAILILIPRTTSIGALIAFGTICGALSAHLTALGIVVQDDGGQLFILALVVFLTSGLLLVIYRKQLLSFIPFLNQR